MKTFTELTDKKLCKFFEEFRNYPLLAGFITDGFGRAVSSYLKKQLMESKSDYAELIIGGPKFGEIMKFVLRATKKGDSVAFIPEFEMLTAGKDFINADEVEFDEKNIVEMSNDLSKNKEAIIAFREAYAGKLYTDEGWEDLNPGDEEKGLIFDVEEDIAMASCSVVASIIEVLCNNKDASSDIEYEIPGLCKFKVSPVKDGYNVTATFDKEFKSNCKSDKLAEELAAE